MKRIAKQEGKLIEYFIQKKQPCFTNLQAKTVHPALSRNGLDKLLSKMVQRELLMRIKEGLYYLIPYDREAQSFMPNWHILAPYLAKNQPHYIGYQAALQIHSLNTQPSLQEQIVVNKQLRPATVLVKGIPFQFIYHNKKHFFGFKKIWIDAFDQVNCSDIEKTIIDCLFKPNYAGGIPEIAKALYLAQDKLDPDKMLTYSQQFHSQAVIKRLGFLLELLGIHTSILEKLQKIKTPSIVPLDPEVLVRGKIVTRWSIQQNVDTITIQSSLYT
jgi:predicted transcriptional regulator of viral defense system